MIPPRLRPLGTGFLLAISLIGIALPGQGQVNLVLTNATVIDGSGGQPLPNATILIAGAKIERIATGAVTPPAGAVVIDLRGAYVLPGFVDAHVHISTAETARRALMTGVTTARSMGVSNFADVGLRELSAAGHIEAPEILAAGYHVRPRPAPALFLDFPRLANLMPDGVRGPEPMRRMARALLERQVDFIKTTATERAGLPDTDPRKQLYDVEELRALVEEGAAAGVPVAAHAHGDEGANAAVRAGVRSIEHGTYLSEATLRLMAERGTYLVPTIAIVLDVAEPGGDYDVPALQVRGRHMLPRVRETVANAHDLGVLIVAATDTGYGPDSVVRMSQEIEELVKVGLSPMEAIQAATTTAAELLGVQDHTGRLAAGLDADLIVVERNPLDEIGTLHDLLMVVNNGKVVSNRITWKETPREEPPLAEGLFWPTRGWPVATPEEAGLDPAPLEALVRDVEAGQYGNIDHLFLVRNGSQVLNRKWDRDYVEISRGQDMTRHQYNYNHPDFHPFHMGTEVHTLQSVTKSITSALVGIAIENGVIEGTDVGVMPFFNEYEIQNLDDRKRRITLDDVLTMRAGIEWHESDYPLTDARNTTIQLEASDDWIQFTLDQPMDSEPGTKWVYNSGASQLLSAIIKKATGVHIDEYAEMMLFRPLGIEDYHWKKTPKGFADTEGGLYLKAEDLGKIGYLFLKGGVWDGEQIVGAGWVAASTARRVDDIAPDNPRQNRGYGYKWWRLDQGSTVVYAGLGYGGQFLLVVPEHQLVGVANSWNVFGPQRSIQGPFLQAMLAAAEGDG